MFLSSLVSRVFRSPNAVAAFTPRARAPPPRPRVHNAPLLSSPSSFAFVTMEAQVAPSQQLAATQSQKPTTQTQPCDPAQLLEADTDEVSEGEQEVRRATSRTTPR